MKNLTTFAILLFLTTSLHAQSYLGKLKSTQLHDQDITTLTDSDDLDDICSFLFALSFNELQSKIKSAGLSAETIESVFRLEDKHIRMDMTSMGEKMSYIINLETNKVMTLMHSQKKYMEMDLDQIKAMQDQMQQGIAAQMENNPELMEKMPPEARAAMEKMMGANKKKNPPKVTATGKSQTINGFPCKQYLVEKDGGRDMVWVTTKYPNLRNAFQQIAQAVPSEANEADTMWDQIEDGWPVVTHNVTLEGGFMGGSYSMSEIYSMEATTHPKGTFDPPAGYEKTSMPDMMMQGK